MSATVTRPKPARGAASAAPARPITKAELIRRLMETAEIPKDHATRALAALTAIAQGELSWKGAPGVFAVPGLVRLKVVRRPATKAKPGRNPATGEPMTIKAKPARNVVKATVDKALREGV